MKRIIPCSIAACVTGVLSPVRIAAITEECCLNPDSSGLVVPGVSRSNGSVGITTDSSDYQDVLELLSPRTFFVYHKASPCCLGRSVALTSNGHACSAIHLANNMIQVGFRGNGSFSTSADTGERTLPDEYLYVWSNTDTEQ